MNTISLKKLIELGVITTISKLSQNSNGYHFVTVIDSNKKATNLYFSKNSNELVKNYKVGDDIIRELIHASVVATENTEKKVRFKISIPSAEGKYSSKTELLSVFGIEEQVDFDLESFKATFQAKPAVLTAEVQA